MPELRKDPITGRWVIISTERALRPKDYTHPLESRNENSDCPFCEGHESMTPPEVLAYRPNGGEHDTPGWTVRVFPNKYPALRIEGELNRRGDGIFDRMNGVGAHEVIIESPNHLETLSSISVKETEDVF